MKRKRLTDEQRSKALKPQESGVTVAEICRDIGPVEPTFSRWQSRYGGRAGSEVRWLQALAEASRRLRKLLADPMPEHAGIKVARSKQWASRPGAGKGWDPG